MKLFKSVGQLFVHLKVIISKKTSTRTHTHSSDHIFILIQQNIHSLINIVIVVLVVVVIVLILPLVIAVCNVHDQLQDQHQGAEGAQDGGSRTSLSLRFTEQSVKEI